MTNISKGHVPGRVLPPLTSDPAQHGFGDGGLHGLCDGAGRHFTQFRKATSAFFEGLPVEGLLRDAQRSLLVAEWAAVADEYRTIARSARDRGSDRAACEAWLCALTALEVVRTISSPGDVESDDVASAIAVCMASLGEDAGAAIERVTIGGFGEREMTATFLAAPRRGAAVPVMICIGERAALDGIAIRLLPILIRRDMAFLLVDTGADRSLKPEHILPSWLDYLEARPDVASERIAVYGEGEFAYHAFRIARLEGRIAAAVCDGGLITPASRQVTLCKAGTGDAGVREALPTPALPTHRSYCPMLVVAGSRSMLQEQEALDLQSAYRQAGADVAVAIPKRIAHPLGAVENFIAIDDFVAGWLESKLADAPEVEPVTYL